MKRTIAWSLALLTVLLLLAFTVSCGDSQNRQIPVYQGMTISSSKQSGTLFGSSTVSPVMDSVTDGNNGNHYGQLKGDHKDRNDTFDEENPFPENSKDENIVEEIKSSLEVVGSANSIYYTMPGQDIYIHIHINNPDSFEIMSFTLNGTKYSSYMFEEGSDMETIILKYNVGNAHGIVEYTIDAIKYVDGTEIKDVLIDGNKTVRAAVKTDDQVSVKLDGLTIGTNSIRFNAGIEDPDQLVAFSEGVLKAVLYDGETLIAEKDLVVGDNAISFEGLNDNTVYQYAIVGYYDNLAGDGFGMQILAIDALYTDAMVLFDNIILTQTSIEFGYLWHESATEGKITSLKLYHGETVTELSTDAKVVGELLSGNTYSLVAEYENGNSTESIAIEFTTGTKAKPEAILSEPTKTKASIGFALDFTDLDAVGRITKIELIRGEDVIIAESLDVRCFENLFSNTEYTVKVTYTYDLNDGVGEQEGSAELKITTDAKTVPAVVIDRINADASEIFGSYTATDDDNALTSFTVSLYKGDTLVKRSNEISFTNLEYYTDYTVRIDYTYDLNDGKEYDIVTLTKEIKTQPYLDITAVKNIGSYAVSEDETIRLEIELANPLRVEVISVIVNGKTYNLTDASTDKKLYLEINNQGQFGGGETTLTLEKFNIISDDGIRFAVTPERNSLGTVFINGKLKVTQIEFVNENFEPIQWAYPEDTVYLMYTIDNPTNYTITYSNATVIQRGDGTCYIAAGSGTGWVEGKIPTLTYSNAYIEKTVSLEDSALFFRLPTDEVHYIRTADDLLHMEDGYYYELANDIDLDGMKWKGGNFSGVFNGKGYAIKNISLLNTVKESVSYLGLFVKGSGVVENLHIQNVSVSKSAFFDTSSTIYCGGIIGSGDAVVLYHCTVDGDSDFDITAPNQTIYLSGMVGHANWVFAENCTNNATIQTSGVASGIVNSMSSPLGYPRKMISGCTNNGAISGMYAGGIMAYCINGRFVDCINNGDITTPYNGECAGVVYTASESYVIGCVNNGTVKGGAVSGVVDFVTVGDVERCTNNGNVIAYPESNSSDAAGIIRYASNGGKVSDCVNNGDISGDYMVAGVNLHVGFGVVVNCLNTGTVTGKYPAGLSFMSEGGSVSDCVNMGMVQGETSEMAGIVLPGHYTATNCFTLNQYNDKDVTCTIEQVNDKNFYTETLGWSEAVWDFSELDVENGKYPKLKYAFYN